MTEKELLSNTLHSLAKIAELIDNSTAVVLYALAGGLISYGNNLIAEAVVPIIHETKLRLSRDIREWKDEEG